MSFDLFRNKLNKTKTNSIWTAVIRSLDSIDSQCLHKKCCEKMFEETAPMPQILSNICAISFYLLDFYKIARFLWQNLSHCIASREVFSNSFPISFRFIMAINLNWLCNAVNYWSNSRVALLPSFHNIMCNGRIFFVAVFSAIAITFLL